MRPPILDTTDKADMEPNDAYNMVQLIYLLYGIGVLLPWNILLSCLDFLQEKVSLKLHLLRTLLDARLLAS